MVDAYLIPHNAKFQFSLVIGKTFSKRKRNQSHQVYDLPVISHPEPAFGYSGEENSLSAGRDLLLQLRLVMRGNKKENRVNGSTCSGQYKFFRLSNLLS